MTHGALLELHSVSLVASGQRLLDGVDLSIGPTDRVAIVGESGAGKSFLLRLALGLAEPLSGRVSLFGESLGNCDQDRRRQLRRRCGVSFQGGSLIRGLSVYDNLWLALGAPAAAKTRFSRKLDRLGFDFGIGHLFATPVDSLSQGEARIVELARAFVHDPELVLLDGPLSESMAKAAALEHQLKRFTVLRPRALLLVTQDEELAFRACDRIYRLERGRLYAQSLPEPALS